jgi:predicted small lipoprotein YifL
MTYTFIARALALAACGLAGCSNLPPAAPQVDGTFGSSVRHAVSSQTANPEAGKRPRGPDGFDAQAAVAAIAKHRSTFRNPPPTFNIIGVTSGD